MLLCSLVLLSHLMPTLSLMLIKYNLFLKCKNSTLSLLCHLAEGTTFLRTECNEMCCEIYWVKGENKDNLRLGSGHTSLRENHGKITR